MFRRRGDWAARMLARTAPGSESWVPHPDQPLNGTADWVAAYESSASGRPEPILLVRAVSGEREVLVAGHAVPLVDPGAGRGAQVEVASAVWQQNWLRLWKRTELPGKLLEFFSRLSETETPDEVCRVVARSALQLVDGYDAAVLLVDAEGAPAAAAGVPERLLDGMSPFSRAGLIRGDELALWLGAAPGGLSLTDEVSHVAYVPLGSRGLLIVAERRSERIFERDDWEVLAALAEQGDRALERVYRMQSAQELSLSDPLTGLANRREMDVVMKHAWAGAERGEGLAVMMLDLDHFKQVNDTYGHHVGDQVLQIVADSLRQEARGADALVRFGGDEFLVIMPRGDTSGARYLAARLEKRLSGWVEFTAGIAGYHPNLASSADLIRAADEALYAERLRRRAPRLEGGDAVPAGPPA